MNASSAFGVAVVLFSLSAVPASAMVASSKTLLPSPTSAPMIVNADFVQGHEAIAGIPAREASRSQTSKVMAQRYFDVDVIVTLGALALASGAFVAAGMAGGRRRAQSPAPVFARDGWRDGVMVALEADLMKFTTGLRQAA